MCSGESPHRPGGLTIHERSTHTVSKPGESRRTRHEPWPWVEDGHGTESIYDMGRIVHLGSV